MTRRSAGTFRRRSCIALRAGSDSGAEDGPLSARDATGAGREARTQPGPRSAAGLARQGRAGLVGPRGPRAAALILCRGLSLAGQIVTRENGTNDFSPDCSSHPLLGVDDDHSLLLTCCSQKHLRLSEASGQWSVVSGQEAAIEEWEVPCSRPADWPPATDSLITQFWEARIARQKEIDELIARAADVELLYDKPHVDSGKVRVAGPFTVESLSPHRVIPSDEYEAGEEVEAAEGARQRRSKLPYEREGETDFSRSCSSICAPLACSRHTGRTASASRAWRPGRASTLAPRGGS